MAVRLTISPGRRSTAIGNHDLAAPSSTAVIVYCCPKGACNVSWL